MASKNSNQIPVKSRAGHDAWLQLDFHGRVGVQIDPSAPTAPLLRDMFHCFLTDHPVLPDLAISESYEDVEQPSYLENDYIYSDTSLEMRAAKVQVVADRDTFRLHGSGELLTSAIPLIDRLLVQRGVGMFHAATVSFNGHGIALPAAGGTGKTSVIAKLMREPGSAFMGDDWAFLSREGEMLGFAKPMFIKPHHRPIYPHLFAGSRKPLVPVRLSRPVGKLTTIVHPSVTRYPRVAAFSRRWSPEHRMVDPARALPSSDIVTSAPFALAVFLERFDSRSTRLLEKSEEWMVSRLMGNFHVEMPHHSQSLVTALGATGLVSLRETFCEKAAVLAGAVHGKPSYLLQVPQSMPPDQASDEIVSILRKVLISHNLDRRPVPEGSP